MDVEIARFGRLEDLSLPVLQYLPVYWFALFHVTVSTLVSLRRLFFQFLWRGTQDIAKYHLAD